MEKQMNREMQEHELRVDLYPSRVGSQPQIMERKDPVVYGSGSGEGIHVDQLAFYEENGYLFIENFFSEEEVASIREDMKRMWSQAADLRVPEVIREPGGDEVRSVFAVHRDHGGFAQLSQHPRLTAIAKHILGSDVYIHQSRVNFKPGFNGKEFYWHSDFETWHVEDGMPRMRALSCSIALEDNYAFNGPLMLIPGSHRFYVSCPGETPDENYKESLRKQVYGVPDPESLTWLAEQGNIAMPTGKAGSVIFFDCNVMHGSNGNISPYPRSNVFFVYNSVENKPEAPFSGKAPRPDYIASRVDP